MAGNLDRKLRLPRIHLRVLLHAANMRHGTNGSTSLPKEGVLRIFFALKNSAGFEPASLGTKGQHATSRPPKPLKLPIFTLFSVTEGEDFCFWDHHAVLLSQLTNVHQTWNKHATRGDPNFPYSNVVGARICETRVTLVEIMRGNLCLFREACVCVCVCVCVCTCKTTRWQPCENSLHLCLMAYSIGVRHIEVRTEMDRKRACSLCVKYCL